ncbi:hypothetical protein O0J73_07125 [Stenotrophomonas sp. Sm6012]|uniref:hypothetical protein n=1 Tax=Stenotrophomonas sp. Sm6012 TaxID=3002745 RepID=UPI0027E42B40|nr:hypothetical protein [Stenotrophomonas sp. Sm6012]MDQ7280503.1 hypothetical protein [Stenotrophomonas sp. Sm6012]
MKSILFLAMMAMNATAWAQSNEQLQRENAESRAQLAQQDGQQAQPLAYSIQSVRKQEKPNGASHLVITVQVRNQSREPLALNYLSRSTNLVDNHGLSYSPTQNYGKIHGIPVAKNTADPSVNLPVGGSLTFVIDATNYLKNGERMGSEFDLHFTLGHFGHDAKRQIVKLRDFPASFTHVPIR